MDLLDFYKKLCEKDGKLREIFGETEFLSWIIDDLGDAILTEYGIPKDNTTQYEDLENADENMFCRDYWADILFEFGDGKILKEKVIEELKNWKNFGGFKNKGII